MSDTLRIAVGAILGASTGITLVIIVPAAWRALRATFKRRETRTTDDLSDVRLYHPPHHPATARSHAHDSTRRDGALDSCCLICGADGYWRNGQRLDATHPSGKLLIRLPADG